jgi:hypothetical protein
VVEEPLNSVNSSPIARVYFGRLKASKYFFRLPDAKRDRKLWDALRNISAMYRAFLGQKLMVDKLTLDLEEANKKTQEIGRQLEDQISKSAFTYSSIENPKLRPDLIINGSEEVGKGARDQILLNCKL